MIYGWICIRLSVKNLFGKPDFPFPDHALAGGRLARPCVLPGLVPGISFVPALSILIEMAETGPAMPARGIV